MHDLQDYFQGYVSVSSVNDASLPPMSDLQQREEGILSFRTWQLGLKDYYRYPAVQQPENTACYFDMKQEIERK